MSLVPRKTPRGAKNVKFITKGEDFGMVNLGRTMKKDIRELENPGKKVTSCVRIKIYFPAYDNFNVREYTSRKGFTLRQLIERIHKAGIQTYKYLMEEHPENFAKGVTAEEVLAEHAIFFSKKDSDIKVKGGKYYIDLQH